MRRRESLDMRALALFLAVFLVGSSAAAAPMWIERQSIPDPTLLDPVFARSAEQSGASVDDSAWNAFLGRYVGASEDGVNRVRYGEVSAEDRAALRAYINRLEGVDVTALSRNRQLAFWINLYNAATVALILDHFPTPSIRDIDDPWGRPVAVVNQHPLSLGDIEHHILRAVFKDPRIHYALNCASLGCPNLAPTAYAGDTVNVMLENAAIDYINHPRGVRIVKNRLRVSKIYGWYREDFGGSDADALSHLRKYANPALKAALTVRDHIDAYDYDWALNDAAPDANK